MEKTNQNKIPFVGTARIGNFKLWRSRFHMKVESEKTDEKGKPQKERMDIECINISNLEGTWKVQIPSTFEMYAVISGLYDETSSDNVETAQRANKSLSQLFSNMMYATIVGNGFYQKGITLLSAVYAFPDILDKKSPEHKNLLKDVKKTIEDFLVWRQAMKEQNVVDDDDSLRQDDVAETVAEILSDGDEKTE